MGHSKEYKPTLASKFFINKKTQKILSISHQLTNQFGEKKQHAAFLAIKKMSEVRGFKETHSYSDGDKKGTDGMVFLFNTELRSFRLQIKSSVGYAEKFFKIHTEERERIPVLVYENGAPDEAVHWALRQIIKRVRKKEIFIIEISSRNFIVKSAENS